MNDREKWREMVRDIRATSMTNPSHAVIFIFALIYLGRAKDTYPQRYESKSTSTFLFNGLVRFVGFYGISTFVGY